MTYTKTINGRQVFSSCATIQMPDGSWVSNPSPEQIASAGWEVYVPPVMPEPEPEPQTEPDMYEVMEAVKRMLATDIVELSDEDALGIAALYPTWASKDGKQVAVGERLWYDGKLYKVIQAHTVQSDWTPDITPALYAEVSIEEWPDFVQPTGAQDAYNTGDKVTYNGKHYTCKMDNCVYSPDAYPAGWELQD